MKRTILTLTAIILFMAGMNVINDVNKSNQQIHLNKIELRNTEAELKSLESDFWDLNGEKAKTEQEIKDYKEKHEQQEKTIQELKNQVEAKARLKESKVYAESAPTQSDNWYKQFIYDHESGNRTTAVNSIGCRGLGQACPGSKLPCGDDYACQDAWFSNYAIQRYGSWANAYSFWQSHRWW